MNTPCEHSLARTTCADCREHLADLLYAERGDPLGSELAARLAAHLRECPPCAGELQELRLAQSWLDVLSDAPPDTAEPSLAAPQVALYARLARLQQRRDAWRYAALAAGAAAAVVLAALLWRGGGALERSPDVDAPQASATTPSPRDWGPEFQLLAQRLDEQGQVLRLFAAELRAAEGRQEGRLAALEGRAGRALQTSDLQALRVTAIEHDLEKLREFLTSRPRVTQTAVGAD